MLRLPRRRAPVALLCLVLATCVSPAVMPLTTTGAASTSPFAYRGIIEGFYGTPYGHADRVDLVRWEAAHHMNIFVDAPKEDPYVRSLWRHQYPRAELSQLLREVHLGARLGVAWVPDIGPGEAEIPSPNVAVPDRDICFSCASDLRLLVDRFRPFVSAGAKTVMVSFDDTVKASSWPQDAKAFGSGDAAYGVMNAELLDKLARALPGVTVLTVPSDYSGTSATAYLSSFAAHLDSGIVVMWTGTQTVAPTITGSQAAGFDSVVHRKVVVWDNYPVNDYAGGIANHPTNLFLGPVTGRGADLAGNIDGILANPMGEWQASKIPLATLADDLNNPYTYNPEQSWQASIAAFGAKSSADVAELADNSRSSPLGQAESIVFEPDATSFLAAYTGAGWPSPAAALAAELGREVAAPGRLTAAGFDPEFMAEAAAFLARLKLNAQAGLAALAELRAERPAIVAHLSRGTDGSETLSGSASPPDQSAVDSALHRLAALAALMEADHHNVHGDRFAVSVDGNVYVNQNLMDRFVSDAAGITSQWLPSAPMATSSVSVTVNGVPEPSPFRVTLPAGTPVTVVATDGAGGKTELVYSI